MTASTRRVAQYWPSLTRAGGCSLSCWFGTTHDTAGSVPAAAAVKKPFATLTFES